VGFGGMQMFTLRDFPDDGVGAKILPVWPSDAAVRRAHLFEIGRILQFPECGPTHVGINIDDAGNAAASHDIEEKVIERHNLGDLVDCGSFI